MSDKPPEGFEVEANPLDTAPGASSLPTGFQVERNPLDPEGTFNPDYVPPTMGGGNEWSDVAKGALPAVASGFNRGVLDIAGIPMDAATDVANLIKAGAGYAASKVTGDAPPSWSLPSNKSDVIGTSEWLNKEAAKPFGGSIVNVTGDPQSYILQGLHATAEQTGPNALLPGAEEFEKQAPIEATKPASTAEENLATQAAASRGNMGAAVAPPSLAGVSPGLRQAIASAKSINQDALARQIDADTLPQPEGVSPISLRAGSAMDNDQQISLERNFRDDSGTAGLLAKSITENDKKLGSSLGEIRRRATPEVVQRSNLEHGQAAIDAIKNADNAAVTNIRAKYKALADQNGGSMPMDTGSAVTGINDALSHAYLTRTAAQNPVISEIMDDLGSGKPITFERFENARTNLAAVQRGNDANAARAAALVRNGLEQMPLSTDAQNIKAMADSARAAAKARFDIIEQNPAYEAAINDNAPTDINGLHVIGAPSPLADNFMDRYFLGHGQSASRAYIARLQGLMQGDPDFAKSVEASALNHLRKAAGLDENDVGKFRAASYQNARAALAPKADVLMTPKVSDWTEQLGRVAGYENGVGKAGTVNYSNTAPALLRLMARQPRVGGVGAALASHAADVAAAHTPGGIGLLGKRVGTALWNSRKDKQAAEAMLNFARESTAPGAGIDATPLSARATGGEVVSHSSLATVDARATHGSTAHPASRDVGLQRSRQATSPRTDTTSTRRQENLQKLPLHDRTPRASGGKVATHEELVNRLMSRWHAARKHATKTTEPLLGFSDDTIQKALAVVGRSPV